MNSESMPGLHDQGWVAQGLLRSAGRGKGTGSQLFRPKSLPPGSLSRPPVVSDSPPVGALRESQFPHEQPVAPLPRSVFHSLIRRPNRLWQAPLCILNGCHM